ncbi:MULTISPECIES: amidohydrolase family protein [unclassified Novosphingobium]|uniref:Xaa-Pro dipeptidase n=1 Tax=unclassified Novosphingobium TaxID=2644732 RepID=UPI000EF05F2E|nr:MULTISPECIES: amidohydrolase family protein [unclassified Novosphingobium]HCF24424.1 Xaa-Pro dipeptidase [Novosphingobium sp.]HQV04995.1 amidohydrolase family protein [Novosphingobium sp.]
MNRLLRLFAALVALALAAPALADTIYVRAGHLIEPSTGEVLADRLIRIEDGRVAAVTAWAPPPKGAQVIDWSDYWVLPGLIDAHVHLADYLQTSNPAEPLLHSPEETAYLGARNARITLEAGFTTVHDVGSYRGTGNIELRNAIYRGDVVGPRINAVGGYITRPGGGGEVTGLPKGMVVPPEMRMGVASGPAEVAEKVNLLFEKGADSIKLIATGAVLTEGTEPGQIELSGEEIRAAVDMAERHGSWVTAHAHGAAGIKLAITNGVRGIEHASLIDDEGIALAKARGTYLVMDVYNGDYIAEVGRRDGWSADILRKNDETTDVQRQGFTKAVRAGVKVVFGTDAGVFPHGLQARQFRYMVKYGMTPLQAIQSATTVAAEFLGWSSQVGSLTNGRWADMIAVKGNPLKDISELERVEHVMKGGFVVR